MKFPLPETQDAPVNRQERRMFEKRRDLINRAMNRYVLQASANGAGLSADRALREYLGLLIGGLNRGRPGAASHIVLRDFVRSGPKVMDFPTYAFKPEKDHLFDLVDFLDFSTGESFDGEAVAAGLASLPEGVIHNYSIRGKPLEFTLIDDADLPFSMTGMSMVRHGSELSWMLDGGEIFDEETWGQFADCANLDADSADESLGYHPADCPPIEGLLYLARKAGMPTPVKGTERSQVVRASGRFDIAAMSHGGRNIDRFFGQQVVCLTDDMLDAQQVFGSGIDVESMESMARQIEGSSVLWSMAETCFGLPAYFGFVLKARRDHQEQGPMKGQNGCAIVSAPAFGGREFTTVPALRIENGFHSEGRSFTPPRYKVEVDGFWRRLSDEGEGKGPEGERVIGKTWVRGHARWKNNPDRPSRILVKASVVRALDIVSDSEDLELLPRM